MKKYFILAAMLSTLPVFALCPIDAEEGVCSASAGFREKFSSTYSPQSAIKEFSGTPEARLNPVKRTDFSNEARNFSNTESNFNYNSNCQFGVCLQDNSKPIFNQLN